MAEDKKDIVSSLNKMFKEYIIPEDIAKLIPKSIYVLHQMDLIKEKQEKIKKLFEDGLEEL